ncbi:hypothetical protein KW794_00895 [Candidatus Saccharibacteria bacterium]|nr:hypothetical protein [Candidatus Saccharibacteria bacterium]
MSTDRFSKSDWWGEEFNWTDTESSLAPDESILNSKTTMLSDIEVGRTFITILKSGIAVTALAFVAAAVSEYGPNQNQIPTFPATKIDGCYVSTDYKWVGARGGIDDLVIRNVQGVTAEGGKGSECLRAAKIVISAWANHDDYNLNNVNLNPTDPYDAPILRSDKYYAVPLFASTKPQG